MHVKRQTDFQSININTHIYNRKNNMSRIDTSKPETGIDQPVSVIRNNFTAAYNDITALEQKIGDYTKIIPNLPSITTNQLVSGSAAYSASSNVGGICLVSDKIPKVMVYSNGDNWIRLDNGQVLS